jgi:geranylgeranyl pyrophosphate synthase
MISKTPNPELLKIAAAYELFQTAILAHDDIIDNSPKRRGKSSLHVALGNNHFGKSQAICLGDIGFFLAYRLISESNFDDALKTKAITFFSTSIMQTTVGEMLDVELAQKKSGTSQKDILTVARLKTAYYTFVAPLTLGAILAGAEDELLAMIKTYGEALGIAFQLQDDIHDIFGTEQSLKKEVGGDILEGKQTILFAKALASADKKQTEILSKFYGNAKSKTEEIEIIKKIFRDTGALKYTEDLIKKYSKKAKAIIPDLSPELPIQTILDEIIDYVVKTDSK